MRTLSLEALLSLDCPVSCLPAAMVVMFSFFPHLKPNPNGPSPLHVSALCDKENTLSIAIFFCPACSSVYCSVTLPTDPIPRTVQMTSSHHSHCSVLLLPLLDRLQPGTLLTKTSLSLPPTLPHSSSPNVNKEGVAFHTFLLHGHISVSITHRRVDLYVCFALRTGHINFMIFFETRYCYVAHVGCEFIVSLPQLPSFRRANTATPSCVCPPQCFPDGLSVRRHIASSVIFNF